MGTATPGRRGEPSRRRAVTPSGGVVVHRARSDDHCLVG